MMKVYKSNISRVKLVREQNTLLSKVKITSSIDTFNYAKYLFEDQMSIRESFWCLFLNRSNNTIGYFRASKGGITGTVVDVKLILKTALDCLSDSVILLHNHPSGSIKPSREDLSITKRIKEAFSILDMRVLDHLILTEDEFYSFADNNIL